MIAKPIKSANLLGASSHKFAFKSNILAVILAIIKNGLNHCFLIALVEKSNSSINAKIGSLVMINAIVTKVTCIDIMRTRFESILLREIGQALGILLPCF
ncbi:MAG: hypothetical protein QM482_03840 [Sulfurospirillum sp.]